jgi:hypothetical protein
MPVRNVRRKAGARLEPALEGEVNFLPMISCEVIPQNPTFNNP